MFSLQEQQQRAIDIDMMDSEPPETLSREELMERVSLFEKVVDFLHFLSVCGPCELKK